MQIEWSINLVGILNVFIFLGGGLFFVSTIRGDVNMLKADSTEIKTDLKALSEKVGLVAVVEAQMGGLKERFEDEQHVLAEFKEWAGRELSRLWSTINAISTVGRTVMPL